MSLFAVKRNYGKDGHVMTTSEILDVIHEALILYADDISAIENASLFQDDPPSAQYGIMLELKDGSEYRVIIKNVEKIQNKSTFKRKAI